MSGRKLSSTLGKTARCWASLTPPNGGGPVVPDLTCSAGSFVDFERLRMKIKLTSTVSFMRSRLSSARYDLADQHSGHFTASRSRAAVLDKMGADSEEAGLYDLPAEVPFKRLSVSDD